MFPEVVETGNLVRKFAIFFSDVVSSPVMSPKKVKKEHGYFSDVDENEEDTDYVPPDRWRRVVRQGPMYQASVPDTISTGPNSPRKMLLMFVFCTEVDFRSQSRIVSFMQEESLKCFYGHLILMYQ